MIAAVGIYSWIEKETFDHFSRLTMNGTLIISPALLFILIGMFILLIGLTGCVGSLRENSCSLLLVRHNFSRKCDFTSFFFSSVLHWQFSSLHNLSLV